MINKLFTLAEKLNIIVGVGNSEPFNIPHETLKDVPFVNYSYSERTNPSYTMPDAKSLIAVGFPYNKLYKRQSDDKLRGVFSSGAIGEDYHIIVKNKLEIICNELLTGYNSMIFTDTGPLIDRLVALRCGLGYVGKHHGIINDKIGSMFFIGYAITNMPYELWNAEKSYCNENCGNCNRCIKACPTGAISDNGAFDYKKCISYITQKKGVLTDSESRSIGLQIYGCDVCQRVCIKNHFVKAESNYAYPDLSEFLDISNKDFNEIYKNTAAGWRGKKILQRNAVIALGNLKDKRALPILKRFLNDNREEISKTAKWAIEQIEKG